MFASHCGANCASAQVSFTGLVEKLTCDSQLEAASIRTLRMKWPRLVRRGMGRDSEGFCTLSSGFLWPCSIFGSLLDIFPELLGRQTPKCPRRGPSITLSLPLARNETSVVVIDHIGAASDRKGVLMIHSESFWKTMVRHEALGIPLWW